MTTVVATLLAAASAQAQEVVQKALGEGANRESTACTYQFTACDINWCLNASGNLVSLQSTGAVEHISILLRALRSRVMDFASTTP